MMDAETWAYRQGYCMGEWLPINASQQQCRRCAEVRAIPEDCSDDIDHECSGTHVLHFDRTADQPLS